MVWVTVTKLCISWCQNFICHAMFSHKGIQYLQSTLMQLWSCANKLTHFCKGRLIHAKHTAFMTANSKHPAAQSEKNDKPWAGVSAVSFLQHKCYFRFTVLTPIQSMILTKKEQMRIILGTFRVTAMARKCSSTLNKLENKTNMQWCF